MNKRFYFLVMIGIICYSLVIGGCSIHIGRRSCTVKPPMRDRMIVLVKKGNNYGVFIPRHQCMVSENLGYDWFFRTDGKGTFRKFESSNFKSGAKEVENQISFGPFDISWSGNTNGKGWLYYDRFEGERVDYNKDTLICITNQTNIEDIDATNPKWLYKGSPTDKGFRCGIFKRIKRERMSEPSHP